MANSYDVGDRVRISVSFTDDQQQDADPTTVVGKVKDPSGNVTTPSVSNPSTGQYHFDVDVDVGDFVQDLVDGDADWADILGLEVVDDVNGNFIAGPREGRMLPTLVIEAPEPAAGLAQAVALVVVGGLARRRRAPAPAGSRRLASVTRRPKEQRGRAPQPATGCSGRRAVRARVARRRRSHSEASAATAYAVAPGSGTGRIVTFQLRTSSAVGCHWSFEKWVW